MNNNRYLIPTESIDVELEVNKSRFLCHLAQADNPDTAKQIIADIRAKYPDATHHCWAFQTGKPGSSHSIGCSDDGEPHGTAGKPMLNILTYAKVGELVAVVTRYYGGTKLGTGGLARAYSDSVKLAIESINIGEKINWQNSTLSFDYSLQSSIEKLLQDEKAEITESTFDEYVSFKFRYDKESFLRINEKLSNLSKGKLTLVSKLKTL